MLFSVSLNVEWGSWHGEMQTFINTMLEQPICLAIENSQMRLPEMQANASLCYLLIWERHLTLMRTSWALGGATSTSSIVRGLPGSHATAALHLITWGGKNTYLIYAIKWHNEEPRLYISKLGMQGSAEYWTKSSIINRFEPISGETRWNKATENTKMLITMCE